MERLIELFINTEDGEFYDRPALLATMEAAKAKGISAGS